MSLRNPLGAVCLGVTLLAGCAPVQNVGVMSRPPGAAVYLDGEQVGATPMEVRVPRDRAHSVFVKKDGYLPELVVLDTRESADGIVFLAPADVRVRLQRRRVGTTEDRGLEIEVED